uniref:Protein kinase domain-containing protein n=1 Tax=Leptobrachium leishanense TaxID=445787 RepID=A0A8C5LNG8_9ANUR
MGINTSRLCCFRSRRSSKGKTRRPSSGHVEHRVDKCSEYISEPQTELTLFEEIQKIELEIIKEQKMKEGAEKILNAVKRRKHRASVEKFLAASNKKLEALSKGLQDLHACRYKLQVEEHPGETGPEDRQVHMDVVSLSDVEVQIPDIALMASELPFRVYADELDEEDPELDLNIGIFPSDCVCPISLTHKILGLENYPASSDASSHSIVPESAVDTKDSEPAVETTNSSILQNVVVPAEEISIEPEVSTEGNMAAPIPVDAPMSLQDFRCCAVLGRGEFGKVLLTEHLKMKRMFAIKAMKKANLDSPREVMSLMSERNALQLASQTHHPFLVNLFASFQNNHHVFLVMDYSAGGDLKSHLMKASGVFPAARATFYAACVVLGIKFLHKHEIIHRDIKLENIVLDQDGYAKITDFGFCKEGIGYGARTKTMCGTLDYMAPEILRRTSYTRSVDWWSFGVLLYTMLVGNTPFAGEDQNQIEQNILTSIIRFPRTISVLAMSILKNLLTRNPAMRLGAGRNGASKVKKHLFFRETNWRKMSARKVRPPFIPTIQGPEDTGNFMKSSPCGDPVLTPPRRSYIRTEHFDDFDWTAEGAE